MFLLELRNLGYLYCEKKYEWVKNNFRRTLRKKKLFLEIQLGAFRASENAWLIYQKNFFWKRSNQNSIFLKNFFQIHFFPWFVQFFFVFEIFKNLKYQKYFLKRVFVEQVFLSKIKETKSAKIQINEVVLDIVKARSNFLLLNAQRNVVSEVSILEKNLFRYFPP